MKFFLAMIVSLFLAGAVSAQTAKSNFSGDWELDTVKSKLSETMRVESIILKVAQTDAELKILSATKRTKGENRGGSMWDGMFVGGNGVQTVKFNLDGKSMSTAISNEVMPGNMITGEEVRTASFTTDGRLSLTISRNYDAKMGGAAMKANETWELLDEGETLKITRYMETPRGAVNAEMFFTRKTPIPASAFRGTTGTGDATSQSPVGTDGSGDVPRKISGGVLNGKAISLPRPAYPAAARAVKASGAVNVQVTIDENGDIVSASAVSGHPLLRQAAEQAAREAKFSPTLLQGVPVSVTGIVVYNFVP